MPPLAIGVQLRSLRRPFRQALIAARELGVRLVEIDARGEVPPRQLTGTALRQIRKLLDDLDLRVAAVGFATRHGYDQEEGLDRRVAATRDALDLAFRLGAPLVVNQVGRVAGDENSRERQLLAAVLADLGRYGQRCGALLAAETGSEPAADLAALLDSLPAGSVVAALNPGKLIINGFSAAEAPAALGRHIAYVRARDGVRDRAAGRGLEVPLGRGSADFPALLGALEEAVYRGPLIVEREQAADPQVELGQAIEYLRALAL